MTGRSLVGRLRFVIAGMVFSAMVVVPSLAHAATWMSEYPFGTIHLQPSVVGVDLFSETALDARTAVISIDGVAQRTFMTQGQDSGNWTSTETLVNGVWTIRWTWVAAADGSTKARLYCYPATLADGDHTVTATVKDVTGTTLTNTPWTFTLGAAPTFGTLTPAAGTKIHTLTPTVSVMASDNSGSFTATATLNGTPVGTSVSGGKVTVLAGQLADGVTTVSVTARDAAGNSVTKTWSFTVSVSQDKACISCHSGYETDPAMGPYCADCHTATNYTPRHGLYPSHGGLDPVHEPGCKCHVLATADPALAAVIRAGRTDCIACHSAARPYPDVRTPHVATPETGSVPMHQGGVFSVTCSTCHSLSLLAVHDNDCGTCHSSTDAKVVSAIGSWNGTCGACHTTKHANAAPGHDTTYNNNNCTCHSGTGYSYPYTSDISTCLKCHTSSMGSSPAGVPTWTNVGQLRVHQGFKAYPYLNSTFVVPLGVTTLTAEAYGGSGSQGGTAPTAGAGGLGGYVFDEFAVAPLSSLTVRAGSRGYRGSGTASAGQPNGALGADGTLVDGGGAGGASTTIRLGATVLVEAGGGGGGAKNKAGGVGGLVGSGVGGFQTGGVGTTFGGGGGGGGWNRGLGGAAGEPGAGGTSYATTGTPTYTAGVRSGDGYLDLSLVDGQTPITTSDVQPAYMARATINLTAVDMGGSAVKATRYRLDGGPELTGTRIVVPGVGEGAVPHRLEFYSIDNAGNTEVANVVNFTLTADLTPPTTTSNAQPAYWGRAAILLKATSQDSPVVSTWYRLDGGTATQDTLITTAAQGTHTLEFWSVDDVGNIEPHRIVTFDVRPDAPAHTSTRTLAYTGADQYFDVPAGVSNLTLDLYAGQGGQAASTRQGGLGGFLRAFVPVDPSVRLKVASGGRGRDSEAYNTNILGGYPTGGTGYGTYAASGGGSSFVALLDGTVLAEAGAGAGGGYGAPGGAGGAAGSGTRTPTGAAPKKTDPSDAWTYLGGGGGGWNGGIAGSGGTSRVSIGTTDTLTVGVQSGNGYVIVKWITPDYAAPVTTSNAVATYVGSASITLNATDAGGWGVGSTHYRLDGGADTVGTAVSTSAPGAHSLEFWSVDQAGNTEAHKTVSFSVL